MKYFTVCCRQCALLTAKGSWSCVDCVPLKLFPPINIVLKLLREGKSKITQYGCL